MRGPEDAHVAIVYGDYECPFCGRATGVVDDLTDRFGDDLRYVFRHLPLTDVHGHAELAAEASEAAAAQGRFWEMHDALMAHQDALSEKDIFSYARELGLDLDQFKKDLHDRSYAGRVAKDVSSADESGAVGTPTFFLNGRRYQGGHDLESLTAAVKSELAERARPTGAKSSR